MSFLAAFIYRQFIYTPPIPTASFDGKTVIVTGSNVGLGLEACRWMIRLGASRVILACRNTEKGEAAAKDIQATTECASESLQVWHLDMSSYASVQDFCNRVQAELPRLDAVIANAGISTRQFHITENNEETITTNVVSIALLAFLLHPKLHETAEKYNIETHFTVTASELYQVAQFTERKAPEGQLFATLNDESKANMRDRYNVSKLFIIFVIKELAIIAPFTSSNKVIVNCVAPGSVLVKISTKSFPKIPNFCHSSLTREYDSQFPRVMRLFKALVARPTEVGARTLVYGASVGPESHGQYVPDCKIAPTQGLTRGEEGKELQQRVWVELKEKLEALKLGVTALTYPEK